MTNVARIMEAVSTSDTSVNFYKTTYTREVLDDSHLHWMDCYWRYYIRYSCNILPYKTMNNTQQVERCVTYRHHAVTHISRIIIIIIITAAVFCFGNRKTYRIIIKR
jgi:hypothetical protein